MTRFAPSPQRMRNYDESNRIVTSPKMDGRSPMGPAQGVQPRAEGASGSTSKKLFLASVSRKRADQDAVLLQNRINLLKAEEARAANKIKETQVRAAEILDMRVRNERQRNEKEQAEFRKREEERKLRERLLEQKRQQQLAAERKNTVKDREKKLEYQRAVEDRRHAEMALQEAREMHRQDAEEQRQKIRRDRLISQTKAQQLLDEKKEQGARMFKEKIERELKSKNDKEALIREMEREEVALIRKLQETQQRQQAAYEVLEDIISEPPSASTSVQQSRTGSRLGLHTPHYPGSKDKRLGSKSLVEQEIQDKLRNMRGQRLDEESSTSESSPGKKKGPTKGPYSMHPAGGPPHSSMSSANSRSADSRGGNAGPADLMRWEDNLTGTLESDSLPFPFSDHNSADKSIESTYKSSASEQPVEESAKPQKLTYTTASGETLEIDTGPDLLAEELELAKDLNF